jgi:hypothetical protein
MRVTVPAAGAVLGRTALLACATILGMPTLAPANDAVVSRRAAMDGSQLGLEIRVADTALSPASDAFLAFGPEAGLARETALAASFSIDVAAFALAPQGAAQPVRQTFLRLGDAPGAAGARLMVFLEQDGSGVWQLGAWSWDDATQAYVLALRVPLSSTAANPDLTRPLAPRRFELQWKAGTATSRGSLRLLLESTPHASTNVDQTGLPAGVGLVRCTYEEPGVVLAPQLIAENVELDNGQQSLSYVQLGLLASEQAPGTQGRLFFDDVEFERLLPSGP